MADIFLSYAREDLAWASLLAKALAERGWSVFWDRRIPTGKSFDRVIEQELDTARCVIVLWSQHAIASHWVRSEAREGARRDILHPVWVEDVKVPLEFRALQTARLVGWDPGAQHAEFDQLVADITRTLGPERVTPRLTPEPESAGSEPISSLSGRTTIERNAATAEPVTGQADTDAHEARSITHRPRYGALGSIAAVAVLLIAVSVMMLMRPEAPQTLTGDRVPAAAPFVAITTAKDDPDVLYRKGEQYFNGRGVDRDYAKAVEMYRQAADAGHAKAQASLGWTYVYGLGVPKDGAEAAKWFAKAADPIRKAADQGEAEAQGYLGAMYASGRGVPKDDAEAVKWLRKAADQGHAPAQYNLGTMYLAGRGVPMDHAEAAKWMRKAADQGYAPLPLGRN